MAKFDIVIRYPKEDFSDVYISVSHNSKTRYIKTGMRVNKKGVRIINLSGKVKYEVSDKFVLKECLNKIDEYNEKLNKLRNIKTLDCLDIIEAITPQSNNVSFSKFAKKFVGNMIDEEREKSSRNYTTAINSLSAFLGKEDVYFSDISIKVIRDWVASLKDTKRAKSLYPNAIKTMYNSALDDYNDYDKDIIVIPELNFRSLKIPQSDAPEKRCIDVASIVKVFDFQPEQYSYFHDIKYFSRECIAHDVAMLIFYLVGINTVDLFRLEKHCMKNGKLCYNRSKTKGKRFDNAYIEITVPEKIIPLFEKHNGDNKLFNFSDRYANFESFNKYVNMGLRSIGEKIGCKITTYSFRHSWATIARNECGASMEDVAFALNHSSAHHVTEFYVEKDFSRIDHLNRKVIEFVFGENRQ